MRLSQMLTGKHMLHEEVGFKIFNGLIGTAESWDSMSLLRPLLYRPEARDLQINDLVARQLITDEQRRLAKMVVSAWYTGLYGGKSERRLATYTHALMYRPTLGLHNIPSFCGGPTGFWAEPPQEGGKVPL